MKLELREDESEDADEDTSEEASLAAPALWTVRVELRLSESGWRTQRRCRRTELL